MTITAKSPGPSPARPFRRAVLQGVATLLPPLLTVVLFIWAWNTIRVYVLDYATAGAREALVWGLSDVRRDLSGDRDTAGGRQYVRLTDGSYVPQDVHEVVAASGLGIPSTGRELYQRYVDLQFLRPEVVIPVFIVLFFFTMYLVGKFLAAGMGRFFWGLIERGILRLPLVRSVYGSVKQVTDYVLSEREVRFNRIVAVEYPRKGIWSLGFVTAEGIEEIADAVGETMLAVFIPASPWSMTGYVALVKKSEAIELNMTADEALRFIVSWGVVVPESALPQRGGRESRRVAATSE